MIRRCALIGVVYLGIVGCDRSDRSVKPVAPPPAPASAPAEPAPPTTQELLRGPYKRIVLPGMPIAMQVPQSWQINMIGASTFLEGPSPTDHAMIQLSQRETLQPIQFEMLVAGTKKEQEQHPESIKIVELHDVGKSKILERLAVGRTASIPKVDAFGQGVLDASGNLVSTSTTPLHWTITVLVPYEQSFSRYELNFIDMTAEQYEKDKDFLRKIVESISADSNMVSPSRGTP